MKYINVYLVDRRYGGPEEGGWWYDAGEMVASVPYNHAPDPQIMEHLRCYYRAMFKNEETGFGTRFSMAGGVDVEAYIEDEVGKDFPAERPYYC